MADADPALRPATSDRRLLSGTRALVELPLIQRRLDAAAGLDTAGFISGYRGSPLGGYDEALWAARETLEAANIRFQPGLNEDLAATAVWGTQQVGLFPGATVEGVFGIWYGKGPGVDRSMDALKHGNAAGTSANGGVLLIAGDDHGCVSSTLPHQSGPILASAMIPSFAPSTVAEIIEHGLLGIALSRYSGCWVALTGASEVIETTATVDLAAVAPAIAVPALADRDVHIRWPDPPVEQERRLHGAKMAAVAAFAAANRLDRLVLDAPRRRFVIVTTGKAYGDVREALELIGVPMAELQALGVALFKVGLAWPLQAAVLAAIDGADEVLVVEEKRGFVEDQLVRLLYNRERRPRVVGKTDQAGRPLLPSVGELSAAMVARVIAGRLERLAGRTIALDPRLAAAPMPALAASPRRAPFFCAGCPHSSSTRLPEGSRAMGGIGCHGMATWMPDRNTQLLTHMGAEGVTWIGQSPFTTERHVFQNLGDGTYNHSGLLAIRAAVAADVNITYKILYNDAVAMTGGQPHEGVLTVEAIARQLAAEGVKRVVVVAETLRDALRAALPDGVDYRERARLDATQRELRDIAGVTAIIYDQTCAAELRRRRRSDPTLRRAEQVVINPLVCEGCGDCSVQSNCIAIEPLETPLGRKRRIDPASCNQDYSCLAGFCPSFVTVVPGAASGKRVASEPPTDLPSPPQAPLAAPFSILVAGIGGTGVVTVGTILGAAAAIDGVEASILDVTGLSQKNGAVQSQVRLSPHGAPLNARIAAGSADLVLACDVAAAAAPALLPHYAPATRVVANAHMTPTSDFVRDGGIDLGFAAALGWLTDRAGEVSLVDAVGLAERLAGSALAANVLLFGHAWQQGLIPLSLEAIEAAMAQGPGAEANRRAFGWGRAAAADPALGAPAAPATQPDDTLASFVETRATHLAAYQNPAYANEYRAAVARVEAAEQLIVPGTDALARAVADGLFRFMAYKDEYEVARLHLDAAFARDIEARFGKGATLTYHLAPPGLGRAKKRFGPWMRYGFRLLASLRGLRGTAFDPFGRTAERREERRLLAEYHTTIDLIVERLTPDTHAIAVGLASAAAMVRGFGPVKAQSIARYRTEHAMRVAALLESNSADNRTVANDMLLVL